MSARPPTIRRRNPRLQGEIGLGVAIGWFPANGYSVSIPLCDNQPYDLVVEDVETGALLRVQVKTATSRARTTGHFLVALRTCGGNRSARSVKEFDNTASDLLFVYTDARDVYVIPSAHVQARTMIALGPKWQPYKKASDWIV